MDLARPTRGRGCSLRTDRLPYHDPAMSAHQPPSAPAQLDGLRIARVGGISIVVHPTYLVSFALLTWFARELIVEQILPSGTGVGVWALSAALGLAISASILVHEFAHSVVAKAYGLPVRRITLFLFGGVSQIEREAPTPRAEFHIAVAGPLASVLLAVILGGVAKSLDPHAQGLPGPWGDFAFINMVLALFNLIPAFPMDGGRVLRSALWAGSRDRARATRWAALGGRAFAALLVIGGVVVAAPAFLGSDGGDVRGGVWFMLIGWFLYRAAGAAGQQEGGALPDRMRDRSKS